MHTDNNDTLAIPYLFLAQAICKNLDELPGRFYSLASGATSHAFKLHTNRTAYVLRIEAPNSGKVARFESDFAIRRALAHRIDTVSLPVVTSEDLVIENISENWALDSYCPGSSPARTHISQRVSHQLGQLLSILHALPATEFGVLRNARGNLRGSQPNPRAGLLSRFEKPWPFTDSPLAAQPVIIANSSLQTPLAKLENRLLDFATGQQQSIVHSDLHEQQLLVQDNELTALLDFNEAMVGRREWDLGSYLYFHGSNCLENLLRSYCDDLATRDQSRAAAKLAAILIALHHGNRSIILNRPHRLQAAVSFLEGVL